jgi:F0F1-type ATP synthase assembly protein I
MSWLSQILPTIGNLIGGPLGGMAVEAAGKALGLSETTKEGITKVLQSGNLTAEQMSALKKADAELEVRLKELDIDLAKVAAEDRNSARNMAVATGSWAPAALALSITVGFFGVLIGLLTGELKLWDNSGLTLLIGALSTSWGAVVMFYFGSSNSEPSKPPHK